MLLFHLSSPPCSKFSFSLFIVPSLKDSTSYNKDLQTLAGSHGYQRKTGSVLLLLKGRRLLSTPAITLIHLFQLLETKEQMW